MSLISISLDLELLPPPLSARSKVLDKTTQLGPLRGEFLLDAKRPGGR
jgi:hypothetical protein